MRLRRRKRPVVDVARWPLIYVGPTTRYGLQVNSPCAPYAQRHRNGLRGIRTMDGAVWAVPPGHVVSAALRKAGQA